MRLARMVNTSREVGENQQEVGEKQEVGENQQEVGWFQVSLRRLLKCPQKKDLR